MKSSKNLINLFLGFCLILIISLFYACDDTGKASDKINKNPDILSELNDKKMSTPPANSIEAQAHFYHAWLADCTNDTIMYSGAEGFNALATSRINKALQNPLLNAKFGSFGNELVWGPAINLNKGDDGFYSNNLMYILKSVDASNKITYSIGISGTNEISAFDWFNEDFDVKTMEHFTYNGASVGQISFGTYLGYRLLYTLRDSNSNLNIYSFLKQEIGNNNPSNYSISVSGHSLGGALAPVLALGLKGSFQNVSVSAWPYAGPTPGDATFAASLTRILDGYNAYMNTLDVVPHAWQPDRMEALCDLYSNLTICPIGLPGTGPGTGGKINSLAPKPIINGMISYLADKSKSNAYKMAGQPVYFTAKAQNLKMESCANIFNAATYLYKYYSQLNDSLITTGVACGMPLKDSINAKVNYMLYMSELGYQHTTAYTTQFFPDTLVRKAVNKSMTTKPNAQTMSKHGASIMTKLLHNATTYLNKKGSAGCICTDNSL